MKRLPQVFGPLTICVIGVLVVFVPNVGKPQDASASEGEKLLRAACTQCHGLAPIFATRDGVGGWRRSVDKMISWGAQIRTAEERDRLVEYLVATRGPAAGVMTTSPLPPAAALASAEPAALPPGPGADLVKGHCAMCHDLGIVVATRRNAAEWRRITNSMLAKALIVPADEDVHRMNEYLIENFGNGHADSSRPRAP